MKLNTIHPYKEFSERVYSHRLSLKKLINDLVKDGKKIFGYGASTKGNVMGIIVIFLRMKFNI